MWSWRPFWQLFIALNRAATILCNQGVVFRALGSQLYPFFHFPSLWLSKQKEMWGRTKKEGGGEERSEFQFFSHSFPPPVHS